jgi:hypothetical protein
MSNDLQYQLRIYLPLELAEVARSKPESPELRPVVAVLERHDATMRCQFDAFAGYVAEAEKEGTENYPLYEWAKATIEDPEKRVKHLRAFAIQVGGNEVYAKDPADALEAALQPLVGGRLIERMTRHDTNPANNPQVPEQYRRRTT